MENWGEFAAVFTQVAMGVGLAACAGLRVFVPFLAVGLAGRAGVLPLMDSFEWVAGWPAITVFSVAVVLEILADKIPVVDHFLDTIQIFVKPIAGAVLMCAVITDLSPLQQAVLGIGMGGTVSAGIHLTKANLRLLSTAGTGGFGNPVVSTAEDTLTFAGASLAIFAPAIALLLLGFAITGVWLVIRRIWQRRRPA